MTKSSNIIPAHYMRAYLGFTHHHNNNDDDN